MPAGGRGDLTHVTSFSFTKHSLCGLARPGQGIFLAAARCCPGGAGSEASGKGPGGSLGFLCGSESSSDPMEFAHGRVHESGRIRPLILHPGLAHQGKFITKPFLNYDSLLGHEGFVLYSLQCLQKPSAPKRYVVRLPQSSSMVFAKSRTPFHWFDLFCLALLFFFFAKQGKSKQHETEIQQETEHVKT